jgi:senataxin
VAPSGDDEKKKKKYSERYDFAMDHFGVDVRDRALQLLAKWRRQVEMTRDHSGAGPHTGVAAPDSTGIGSSSSSSSGSSSAAGEIVHGRVLDFKDCAPSCPPGIPPLLWKAVSRRYNQSQLGIIAHICGGIDERELEMEIECEGEGEGMDDGDLKRSLQDTHVSLIQGPPGTGKTATIMGMIGLLMHMHTAHLVDCDGKFREEVLSRHRRSRLTQRLLLCAPSNAAVDELAQRIIKGVPGPNGRKREDLKVVRLGSTSPLATSGVVRLTLESQTEERLKKCDIYERLLQCRDAIKKVELLLSNTVGEKELRGFRATLTRHRMNRHNYERELEKQRIGIQESILRDADIVVSTLSTAAKLKGCGTYFATIIDEAGQATEPSTLIPLAYSLCRRLVLVGDPRQLPATVLSNPARAAGLGRSLFERLEHAGHDVMMLTLQVHVSNVINTFPPKCEPAPVVPSFRPSPPKTAVGLTPTTLWHLQYRMPAAIREWPGNYFYGGRLADAGEKEGFDKDAQARRKVAKRLLGEVGIPQGCMFVDTSRPDNNHLYSERSQGTSCFNAGEARFVMRLVRQLRRNPKLVSLSVAIITPYKAQATRINDLIVAEGLEGGAPTDFTTRLLGPCDAATVDSFQGKERDIVIFSCVRTRGTGFLSDERRLNVAVTRAKKGLVMVGHSVNLMAVPAWKHMLASLKVRNLMVPLKGAEMQLGLDGAVPMDID